MKFFLGRALFRYNEGTFYNYQIVDCNVGLLTFVYLPSVRLCMQYWGIQTGGPGQPYSAAKWHGRAWCATHTGMILSLSFSVIHKRFLFTRFQRRSPSLSLSLSLFHAPKYSHVPWSFVLRGVTGLPDDFTLQHKIGHEAL